MREFEIIKLNDDSFSIEAGFVRFFLLKGTEKALLIDSGIEIDCVRALARTILKEAEPGGALDKAAPEESVFFSEETVQEKGKEEILPMLVGTSSAIPDCQIVKAKGKEDGETC